MIDATVLTTQAMEKLKKATPAIMARIRYYFGGLLIDLQTHIKENKLSGQVLNKVTTTLARSIHVQPLEEDAGGITGKVTVGPDAPYGAVHEWGGDIVVPAHKRTVTMVYGRPVAPHQVDVRQYTAHYPERAFMRPSLEEWKTPFRAMLMRSVTEAEA